MPENLTALVVVFARAVPAIYIARQLAGSVVANREFTTWRNTWFAATAQRTVSSVDTIPHVYCSLAGLCVAFIRIAYRERVKVARAAHVHQVPV